MASRWLHGALPAEPPERVRLLDPRIATEFEQIRRRHNLGMGILLAMGLGLLLLAFANLFAQGSFQAAVPSWLPWALAGYVVVFVGVAAATMQAWRCPGCHKYLSRELYWPGTKIQLCNRCGVRLR